MKLFHSFSLFSRSNHSIPPRAALLVVIAASLFTPRRAHGCACGCGIYEVGTSSMLPTGTGIMTYLDYDYQDQNQNWSGDSPAPAADNGDKDIRTSWYTLGYQQMFSREWGLRIELPYEDRHFVTTGGATGDEIVALNFSGLGDIRVEGLYTGFSPDLSAGVLFGLKLPTGSYNNNDAWDDVDRDSQIGTGSTDILLGGYDRFDIGRGSNWSGFTQALLDAPVLTQVQYRPGVELDSSIGAYYNGFSWGRLKIAPILQLKVSLRTSDSGANASSPIASGFARLLGSPGIEIDCHPFTFYTDVELPICEYFRGNQLAARTLFRANIGYMF